jgi:hypothetical protein
LAAFASDAEARACMAEIAQLPDGVAHSAVDYLALFRPPKRALSWSRAHRLLTDIAHLMDSPALHRGGRDHAVTPELWAAALTQVVDQRERLTLPLKSHGYLLTILASLAQHRTGDAEMQRDAEMRAGLSKGRGAGTRAYERRLVVSENSARERLGLERLTADDIPDFLQRERKHEHA